MLVNGSVLNDTRKALRVYNLNPYIVHTVNIYFITVNGKLFVDVLSPDSEGNPRLSIKIDGNDYPLMFGLPGETPNNPIQYLKSIEQAKYVRTEYQEPDKIPGFVGSDKIPNWKPNTNVSDVDDFIDLKINIKSIPTQVSTHHGYGSSAALSTPSNPTGKYGYGSAPDEKGTIVSYGGYGNDFIFSDCAIIIEESARRRYDYLYNIDVSYINDHDQKTGYGTNGFGGVISGSTHDFGQQTSLGYGI